MTYHASPVLLLSLIIQGLWIDVPFAAQNKNGCGSASIWMVMEYWRHGSTQSVEEIHRQLYSPGAGGIHAREMERYFRDSGFRTFAFRGNWTELEQHLGQGRPLIVCLERNARGVPLHYVVVAGIDTPQSLILLNDPAQRKLVSMHRAAFERAWKATDNWTLLALPELELASRAFRERRHADAKDHLAALLKSHPSDTYANEFMGTVHFLDNNIESALKYWNRAGKPVIEDIRVDPPLRADPVLLDNAFAFSRASVLTLAGYRTTQARLDATGLFLRHRMELSPAGEDRFDLTLRAAERSRISYVSWLRGLAYETVYPELFDIGGTGTNVRSMLRWNSQKRRAYVSVAAPLGRNAKWSYEAVFDVRRESWMRRVEVAAGIRSVPSGRWSWKSGIAIAYRELAAGLPQGKSLKYTGSAAYEFVRDSDRHWAAAVSADVGVGKLMEAGQRFVKLQTGVSSEWSPLPGYEFTGRIRTGKASAGAPHDERFSIGLDRDSELWLRGHDESRHRWFALANWDFQKRIYDDAFLQAGAGPFFDVARVARPSPWRAATGLQLRVTALGAVSVNLSYGRDVKTGESRFFFFPN